LSGDRVADAVAELAAAIRSEIAAELATTAGAPDRLLSIPEAAATLGLGRSLTYSEIAAGRLRSIRVGRRRLIPADAIRSYIAERVA
jgi:excisionase family DNA binding protein